MSSLYRDLNTAAINAKLNKNEFLIFSVLMSQTLGFGKCSDPLTDARIAADTGIRLDRVRPALKSFLKRDIFQRRPHNKYQYEYYIADRFLDQQESEKVYTPHCAKSGEQQNDLTTNGGEQPTKRGHTVTNQTEIQKTPPPQTTENTFTKTPPPQKKETDLTKKQPPPKTGVVKISMSGLPEKFVIQSSEPVHIEFSSQPTDNIAVAQHDENATEAMTAPSAPATEDSTENAHVTAMDTTPDIQPITATKADNDNHNELEIADIPPVVTIHDNSEKPVVVVDKKEDDVKPTSKPRKVPKAVGEVNLNACNRQFKPLTKQQQDRVLLVFYAMLKTGTIRRPANYFIGLCKLAKTDDLTIPVEVQAQQTRSKAEIAAQEEEQRRRTLWGDYVCIQRFAQAENESEETIAKRMGMEEAYAMYGQVEQQCAA